MHIYVTSRNTGPSFSSDPIYMLYLGPSYHDAIAAVGSNFLKYEKPMVSEYPKLFSALPKATERELVRYYEADGWWYSVEKVEF